MDKSNGNDVMKSMDKLDSMDSVDGMNGIDGMDGIVGVNENDMIHVEANNIGHESESIDTLNPDVLSKMNAEKLLLKQRVREQHEAMKVDVDTIDTEKDVKQRMIKGDGVVSADILSSNSYEGALKEKMLLKRLNVMDYVRSYKNAFFREVEELDLNVNALVDNWDTIKKQLSFISFWKYVDYRWLMSCCVLCGGQ